MGTDEEARESDTGAVEQIKVKLSAFTYLDEHFESARLIISSPFFICAPLNLKAAAREESFPLSPLPPRPLFLIRVITIHPFPLPFSVHPSLFSVSASLPCFIHMRMRVRACVRERACAHRGWLPLMSFPADMFYACCRPGQDNFRMCQRACLLARTHTPTCRHTRAHSHY